MQSKKTSNTQRTKKSILIALGVISTFSFQSLSLNAAESTRPEDKKLKKFMKDFHKDPMTVINIVPEKTENLPDLETSINRPFDFSKPLLNTLVEDKDSIRKLFCTEVDGKEVCLKDEEGRAQIEANDRVENLVDNGNSAIKNLKSMDDKNLQSARLSNDPWSDDYWAIAKGVLGKRYGDSKSPDTLDWKVASEYSENNPVENYVLDNRVEFLSPSEKYDLLLGDKNMTLTKAMWAEGKAYYDAKGEVEAWMGICHGWAQAAYMLERPVKPVTLKNKEGLEIKFYPSDIKSLGSLIWAKAGGQTTFIGGRCNTKDPKKDENGRIIDEDCFNTNPGTWHQAVVNQLGINKRSLIIDATFDYEVWNQPVVSYSYRYFNLNTFETSSTYENVTIPLSSYTLDKFQSYRGTQATKIVGVEMQVEYTVETHPVQNSYDSKRFDATTTVTYRYDLELDDAGNILGGEWYSNIHPDFLWTAVPGAKARSVVDDYVKGEWNDQIPSEWSAIAPYASQRGIPLAKIVEGLFKRAAN